MAPRPSVSNRKLVHTIREVTPAKNILSLSKQRISDRWRRIGGRTVGIEHTNVDVIGAWEVGCGHRGRSIREHLEHERRSVIRDAIEVHVEASHICETKEGGEHSVRVELDAEFLAVIAACILDRPVQELNNLRGKRGARHCSDRFGFVVGKIPFVVESQCL